MRATFEVYGKDRDEMRAKAVAIATEVFGQPEYTADVEVQG